jgi:PD-(D/E)XK endonuclease
MSFRSQGALGIGRAIAHYSAKGYAVFVPVADVSRYDLIIDTGDRLLRVEVKTTTQLNGEVSLRTMGGNTSWNGLLNAYPPRTAMPCSP